MAELSDHELLDRIEELSEEQVDEMLAGFAKNREIGDGNESL